MKVNTAINKVILALAVGVLLMPTVSFAATTSQEDYREALIKSLIAQVHCLQERLFLMEQNEETLGTVEVEAPAANEQQEYECAQLREAGKPLPDYCG